jgi:hypothetical protein
MLVCGVVVASRHVPEFMREAGAGDAARRKRAAEEFLTQGLQLRNDVVNEPRWDVVFSAEQINGYLSEELDGSGVMPGGVRALRVGFEQDRVLLGCRLEEGPVRGVLWAAASARMKEPGTLELCLESVSLGLLPVPLELVRSRLESVARVLGVDVTWVERDGEAVLEVRSEAASGGGSVVLDRLEFRTGQIRLVGRNLKRGEAEARKGDSVDPARR